MHGLFAGLATLDVAHSVGTAPDPLTKTTSTDHLLAAGGPATNAAVTFAGLCRSLPDIDEGGSATLLTAVGRGPLADLVHADLVGTGVDVLDATAIPAPAPTADAGPRASLRLDPALSGIVEHPDGRMVVSTNARLDIDTGRARELLADTLGQWDRQGADGPDVVLVDGHNPELAALVLRVGTGARPAEGPADGSPDPFAELEDRPSHLRVLDGGSWKPWLTPLLGFVDVAVISADFRPPVLTEADGDATADFLRGFGVRRVVRTDGANPVRWWWGDDSGEVTVTPVPGASTLGAGDVFHGAFAWALARDRARGLAAPEDPTAVISFAAEVATLSTRTFGTRTWLEAPELGALVAGF